MTTDRGGNATAGVPLPRETPFVTAEAALDAGERVYADAKNRRWRADSARPVLAIRVFPGTPYAFLATLTDGHLFLIRFLAARLGRGRSLIARGRLALIASRTP